jgi:hypothetical protein
MELDLSHNNLLPGIPALSATASPAFTGTAAAVLAQPNVVAASLIAAGRVADHEKRLFPDIQPLDLVTDDKILNNFDEKLTFYDKKLIPGYGESYPVCGNIRFTEICPGHSDHPVHVNKHRCHRAACPVCWSAWAYRQSKEAQQRLDDSRPVLNHDYKARHVSLSFGDCPYTEGSKEAKEWLFKCGRKAVEVLGIVGCLVIPHPYRIKSEYKNFVNLAVLKEKNTNRYAWVMKQPNWHDYIEFSPHLHLVGFGKLMNFTTFHHKTGWVYKNHDHKQDLGREGDDLSRTIYYLLSHAWARDNKNVLRYWGDLSNKRLTRDKIETIKEAVLCPVCKTHMLNLSADRDYQDISNAPHAYRKIPIYIYKKRTKPKPVIPAKTTIQFMW